MQGLACVNIHSCIRSRHTKVQRGVMLSAWTLLVREDAASWQRGTVRLIGLGGKGMGEGDHGTRALLGLRSAIPETVLHMLA